MKKLVIDVHGIVWTLFGLVACVAISQAKAHGSDDCQGDRSWKCPA